MKHIQELSVLSLPSLRINVDVFQSGVEMEILDLEDYNIRNEKFTRGLSSSFGMLVKRVNEFERDRLEDGIQSEKEKMYRP